MPASGSLRLAWTFARRELRGGLVGFRVLMACLALGVFAIAAAGSTNQAVRAGMRDDAQMLLGGDLEARLSYRALTDEQRTMMAAHGTLSDLRELRAMARTGTSTALAEVKAVDAAYPLYDRMTLRGADSLATALAPDGATWGAAAEPGLADRLGITLGDQFEVGSVTFVLRALIDREPDRVASVFAFGPRLMIAEQALEATGLIQPGSLIRSVTRLRIEDGTSGKALMESLDTAFPDAGWRLRTVDEAAPGLQSFLDNITLFLTLVGLTALLVGGIGVANAVRAFIDGRITTIATLKCLGASSRLVFRVYLLQIGVLAGIGIGIGLVLGVLTPLVAGAALGDVLPVQARFGVYIVPILSSAAFGVLTALVFGLIPLARARLIPAAALFRDAVTAGGQGRFRLDRVGWVIVVCVIALIALTIFSSERRDVAAGFVVGSGVALILFRLAAGLVMRGARWAMTRVAGRPALRLGLANLQRPGAPTASVVLSLGLGLTVLVTIALIQANLRAQIIDRLPQTAPAYFVIDIQNDQRQSFDRAVSTIEGAHVLRMADMVRGRIIALNGKPLREEDVAPEARWAVRGDRGFSSAATMPENTELATGTWWAADYAGPPLISLTADIAKGLGVVVGDAVTVNVLGRELTGTIASTRTVDWSSLSMNFAFLFSPATLEGAPRSWIATVAAPQGSETALERAIVDAVPNATAISVRQALATVRDILETAGQAVRATAAITLLAGGLVLSAAIAAGHRRRIYDAVVLKVLGAVRADILRAYVIEYGILGLATGVIAAAVGTVAAWAVLVFVMRGSWQFMPGVALGTVALCVVATTVAGFIGTARAMLARPGRLLRNE